MRGIWASIIVLILVGGCKEKEDPEVIVEACFQVPTELQPGETGTFDASCSVNAETYLWDFGDGTTASGSQVSHKFTTPGAYKVTLEVETAGKRDTVSQYVKALADPAACLPSYMVDTSLYPGATTSAGRVDSMTFSYLTDGKLDQIRWWVRKPQTFQNVAKLAYDMEGKVIRIDLSVVFSGQITASFIYDNNKRPVRMNVLVHRTSSSDSLWVAYYKHDQNGHLNQVDAKWFYPGSITTIRTRYETDPAGNALKVYYSYVNSVERLVRDNKAFHPTKPLYSASKELRFYLEYFAIVEPYYNHPKTSHISEARYDPGGNGYLTVGQSLPGGGYAGALVETEVKLNAIGLVQSYKTPGLVSNGSGGNNQSHGGAGYICK